MTDSDRVRISVALARSGLASRRAAEEIVRQRRVAVDGQVTTQLSLRVDPTAQEITVDGQPLPQREALRYYALNKPRGVLSTARDDRGRRTVVDFLPKNAPRCVPVGRLDLDSEGLMLLTNDGPLVSGLLHPSQEIPRVYLAEVIGHPSDGSLDRVNQGVNDGGDLLRATPSRSRRPGRKLANRESTSWLTMTLHTGRKREVRRLCEAIGHPVVTLRRVRFGPLLLRDQPEGAIRPLSRREIRLLKRAAGQSADANNAES
jgi:23S rRNA pseudouridine2605 synthase